MPLSRKTYEDIADCIRKFRLRETNSAKEDVTLDELAWELCQVFAADDSAFSPNKFMVYLFREVENGLLP